MSTARDKFWLWGLEAGSTNNEYGLPASSRMTPAEGAYYMGIPNLIMVRYEHKPEPPFDQYALALSPLKRLVWSLVNPPGDEAEELKTLLDLASSFPNVSGLMMDDFFNTRRENGTLGIFTPDDLAGIRQQLEVNGRKLDLWVVLYEHQLDLPVGAHLEQCDVVTYGTWWAERLTNLERNFARAETLAPKCRKVLGGLMWDFGNNKPMPVDLMQHQCQLGLKWLKEGHIDGIVFVPSCICDLGLEAVEWTRKWIQEVGEEGVLCTL